MADFSHRRAAPTVSPRLDTLEIEYMLAHVLLIPELFHRAKTQLTPELFSDANEMSLKLTWQSVLAATAKWGTGFLSSHRHAWSVIELAAKSYWAANSKNLPPEIGDKIFSRDLQNPGILFWTYTDVADSGVRQEVGLDLLLRFLRERKVHDNLIDVIKKNDLVPDDYGPLLRAALDEYSSISQVATSPVESAFPSDWRPVLPNKIPTNIDFLDAFLNGGHVGGETYGLLGGYGSGKTTLAVQLLGSVGKYEQDRLIHNPQHVEGECYLFHWEDTSDNYRIRLISHMAQIHRDHVEEWVKDLNHLNNPPTVGKLSLRGGLKPYELERYGYLMHTIGLENINGEYERMMELLPRIRERNMHVVDMSGTGTDTSRGSGYIQEIADWISDDIRRRDKAQPDRKHHVSVVIIDYAGICAKRHMRVNNMQDSVLRHLVGEFGDTCMRLIGKPHMTPVWIMHQLAGSAQKRTAASSQHYSDAAESKSFAENMWFCFALGTLDPIHQVTQLTMSKARRAQLGRVPRVRISGPLSTMVDVTDRYTITTHGRVVPVELANQVNPGAAVQAVEAARPSPLLPPGGIYGPNLGR